MIKRFLSTLCVRPMTILSRRKSQRGDERRGPGLWFVFALLPLFSPISLGLFSLGLGVTGSASIALAQVACPARNGNGTDDTFIPGIKMSDNSGICIAAIMNGAQYDNPATFTGYGFALFVPDTSPRSGNKYGARLAIAFGGVARVFNQIRCEGASKFSGLPTAPITIFLDDGATCSLYVRTTMGETYSGAKLRRVGSVYSITAGLLSGGAFGGAPVPLDVTPPTLTSFTRRSPATTPTNADALLFTATFDEDVLNVDDDDFAVSGASTAGVIAVKRINAQTYDITVGGGDLAGFNGVIGLDLAPGQNIVDLFANPLPNTPPATDETYTLDNAPPTLVSFKRLLPLAMTTNADMVTFQAIFDMAVTGVSNTDFAVTGGSTGTTVVVTPVNGTTYDIKVSDGDLAGFNGQVGLDLNTGHGIADIPTGNALPDTQPGIDETYTLDNLAPGVTIAVPATSTGPFLATITFSEPVFGFVLGDIVVGNGTTSSFDATAAPVYTALITPTVDGDVTLDLPAAIAQDGLGNNNTAAVRAISTFTTPVPVIAEVLSNSAIIQTQLQLNLNNIENGIFADGFESGDLDRFNVAASMTNAASSALTAFGQFRGIVNAGQASQISAAPLSMGANDRATERGGILDRGTQPLRIWGFSSYSGFDSDFVSGGQDRGFEGDALAINIGVDTRATENTIIGLSGGYQRTEIDIPFVTGEIDENLYTVSPYAALRLTNSIVLWGTAGVGLGDVETSRDDGSVTGETSSLVIHGSTRLRGTHRFKSSPWSVTGSMGFLVGRKLVHGFTESDGTDIPDTITDMRQANLQGSTAYEIKFDGYTITPYGDIGWDHDFIDPINDDKSAFDIGGGLRFNTNTGFGGHMQYSQQIDRDHFDSYIVEASLFYETRLTNGQTIRPFANLNTGVTFDPTGTESLSRGFTSGIEHSAMGGALATRFEFQSRGTERGGFGFGANDDQTYRASVKLKY